MSRAHLHLTFPEHLIDEPVLYRLGKDFDIVPNIRRANVDGVTAWVIVEVNGDDEEIDRAVAWLAERGVHVDRIAE